MRIRLAVIPSDDLTEIKNLVDHLRSAVNAGDMDRVDAATGKLLVLTANMRSENLPEEEWRRFLGGIRVHSTGFQSDYLVSGELCSQYFPDATAQTTILQLPFNEREDDDV